tara:strand:+ start:535 stop:1044 length:510 start_codon:yes stop_codon:yes gene_type:complete
MELSNQPSFDAPIPGQSLTAELGGRPWQTPPQYTTVDEAIDYYMERMSSEEFMVQLADILEAGTPVTVLANIIQMASVMDGKHTVDVGMLVLPMLMEMIMMVGDSAGIKYDDGMKDNNKPKTRDSLIAKVISKYEKELGNVDLTDRPDEEEQDTEEVMEEPKGLMARRT